MRSLPSNLIAIRVKVCHNEYPSDSFLKIEPNEKAGSTRLRLSTKVIADLPDDIPEFKRESGVQGWNYFIGKQLKAYLEKP